MLSLFVSIDAFSITRVSMPVEVDTAGMHGVFPPPQAETTEHVLYTVLRVYDCKYKFGVLGEKSRFDQSRRASWFQLIFSVGAQDVAR